MSCLVSTSHPKQLGPAAANHFAKKAPVFQTNQLCFFLNLLRKTLGSGLCAEKGPPTVPALPELEVLPPNWARIVLLVEWNFGGPDLPLEHFPKQHLVLADAVKTKQRFCS